MNQDLTRQAAEWLAAGETVAMATIVRIRGSASQPLASRMFITSRQRFVGAVSGGCVESDVYQAAQDVLAGDGPLMLHYKHVENPLIEIGLNCEGQIDVLVEVLDEKLLAQLTSPPTCVNVTLCSPNEPLHPRPLHACVWPDGTASATLPDVVLRDALAALEGEKPQTVTYPDGRVALFEPIVPPPTLLIFGAEQIAVPLVRFARKIGRAHV